MLNELESIQDLDSPLPLWEKDITSKSGNLRTTQQRVTFLFEFAIFSANCLQISTFFPNFATKLYIKKVIALLMFALLNL